MELPLEAYLARVRATLTPLLGALPAAEAQALWALLPVFETALAEGVDADGILRCPYSPSPGLEARVVQRARSVGVRQPAARLAIDRLWFHLHGAGLLRRRPDLISPHRGRDLAVTLTLEGWEAAVELSRRHPRAPAAADDEADLVRAVLESLLLEDHLTISQLLRVLAELPKEAINWVQGWIVVPVRSSGTRAARPHRERFVLSTPTRLAVVRLELFYRRHPALRPPTHPGFLRPNWQDPGRLRPLLRTLSHASLDARATRRGAAVLGLLSREPVFLARRAGRLLTIDAPSADLQKLGFRGEDPLTSTQQPRRHHFPARGVTSMAAYPTDATSPEAGSRLRALLQSISSATTAPARRGLAQALREARRALPQESNLGLVAEYGAHLLGQRDLKPLTIRNKLTGLSSAVDAALGGASLLTCDTTASLTDLTAELLSAYDVAGSQLVMRQRLLDWFAWLRVVGYPVPALDRRDPELAILGEGRCLSLLSIDDIEAAALACRETQGADGHALAAAVVVAGFGGVRRHELCQQPVENVRADPRWTFSIYRSKSWASHRHVPLALPAPPSALELVAAYHRRQRLAIGGTAYDRWLLTGQGEPWDPDQLSAIITAVLRKVSGNPAVVFHSLRRAAATWLLVRWCAGQGWPVTLPCHGRWAEEFFAPEGLARVQELLGTDGRRVLWQLAAFLGHLTPLVTLGHYIGGLDWLESFRPGTPQRASMSYREAAALLGVAPRYVYQALGRDFSEERVLVEQLARLALSDNS